MKRKSKSTKKSSAKKAATVKGKSAAVVAEYNRRLGPVKKVVKTSKAEGTENSVVLHLECGHKRVATKRRTLRCRRCAKGGK